MNDLDPRVSDTPAMRDWPSMTFAELKAALTKRFKITIPVSERDDWEQWFDSRRAEAMAHRQRVVEAEAEINARVYSMFELTPTEIAAIEDALAVISPALTLAGYEAISAVEGLTLSDEARGRLAAA